MGDAVAYALLVIVLIVAAAFDLATGRVPNALTLPAILIGLGWAAASGVLGHDSGGALAGLKASGIGLAVAFVPFFLLFAGGGIGGGDAKLMTAVGAISASWHCVVSTTIYAVVVAAFLAVVVMIREGLVRQTLRRIFGAVLLIGSKRKAELDREDTRRIPFAVAVAIGGIVAGLETLIGVSTPWAAFTP